MSVLSHPRHKFAPGEVGSPKGKPKGRAIGSWLARMFDERIELKSPGMPIRKATRGEAFANWLILTITNQNEEASVRTAAMKFVLDRVDPVRAESISLPDIKILIVQDAPQSSSMITVEPVKALPQDGNGNGRSQH